MPKTVAEEYPELMHYTSDAGLTGILTSGCLWATDARHLNDVQELTHFFDARLRALSIPEIVKALREIARNPAKAANIVLEGGIDHLARVQAEQSCNGLREVVLNINRPFIFSLCGSHDPRVLHNGLLSQWRGYGQGGGYALIFNSLKFEELLRLDNQAYQYQFAQWGDVYYYGLEAQQPSHEEVAEAEATICAGIAAMLRNEVIDFEGTFYHAITRLSCLFKHWGFAEEKEVRVVAIPAKPEYTEQANTAGEIRLQKPILTHVRKDDGQSVPYIELFRHPTKITNGARLPIKRVIIGPHKDAAIRVTDVQRLLAENDYDVPVVISEIPYVGR